MGKFKVGDRVLTASGKHGVVDSVFDNEQYAVRLEGSNMPDRIEGFKLKACNTRIDELKVGDRVTVRSIVGFKPTEPVPATITQVYRTDNRVAYKRDDGKTGIADAMLVTKNAVANAKFKVGDKIKHLPTGFVGVIVKRNDWDATTEAYDVKSQQTRNIMTWEAKDMVAANAALNYGTNPNYKPEEGMKMLEKEWYMFRPSVAKEMVEDAIKKGVKVPDKVMKMYKENKWNNTFENAKKIVANAKAWCGAKV